MLKQRNRLKKKSDFERVFKQGKGFKEDFLYFKVAKNNLPEARFGFIVGKTFSKKAAERNKIKRRLREIVKENIPTIKSGIDCVLVVMPEAENDFNKLKKAVEKLFQTAGIIVK